MGMGVRVATEDMVEVQLGRGQGPGDVLGAIAVVGQVKVLATVSVADGIGTSGVTAVGGAGGLEGEGIGRFGGEG